MRTDLNMRKGKMVAQGAHASVGALHAVESDDGFRTTGVLDAWASNGTTKVCVGVDSEQELMRINAEARRLDLPVHLVTDSGRTEFDGVATKTCLAIGPWWIDEVDRVTGELRLL